jgi:hypothetical protein
MNLGVHFTALLIVYYLIIQQLQMERRCICFKCHIEHDAPTYVKLLFFNHQLI